MGNEKDLDDSSDNNMPLKCKRHIIKRTKESKTGSNLRGGGGNDIGHSSEGIVQERETYSSANNLSIKEYAALPIKNPHEYASLPPYVEPDDPSTNYSRLPPYVSTPFERVSIHSYDPFFGGSSQHFNFASPFSTGIPCGPLLVSGTSPSSSISTMGNESLAGGVCGQRPPIDQYGMCMPIGPMTMVGC